MIVVTIGPVRRQPEAKKRSATALALAVAAVIAVEASPAAADASRRLRLEECLAIAARQNLDIMASGSDVAGAEAARSEVRGELGPKLHADASLQRWNSAYEVPFAAAPGGPVITFPVRDAFTWNATVTLAQPLTSLMTVYETYKMRDLGVDIAELRREVTRREVMFRVVEAYYRLLHAGRLADVAHASVEQLEGQLRQANSLHQNGVVSQNDVLRAQLALANAQQRVLRTTSDVTLARSRLAVLLGYGPDAPVDAEPLTGEPAADDGGTIEQVEQRARAERVELREFERRIAQADHGVSAARLKLVPQVSAVGVYQHVEGSEFSQTNAAYVGAVASWDVWDWGTTTSGITAAKVRLQQSNAARNKLDHDIGLEVRRAYVELQQSKAARGVARAAVAQAEENFRLITKRYEASAATSFDVVDAEALLTQARGQFETSLYDYLVARAALRRATGDAQDGAPR